MTEILKILTGSFFAEDFSLKRFPPKLFVINISTVFTENVYFYFSYIYIYIFFLEFIIYKLFNLLVMSLVCLFCYFYSCLVTTQDVVPFHLGIVVQEIEILKGFLLIVCTVMLKIYYEEKIIKLHIRDRLFVKRMHYIYKRKMERRSLLVKTIKLPMRFARTLLQGSMFCTTVIVIFLFIIILFDVIFRV